MSQTALELTQVGKCYRLFSSPGRRVIEALDPFGRTFHDEFWALRDISLSVPRGATVGILGRNGSGKSTLLQIVAGVMPASAGSVQVNGRVAALLQLGAGFNPEFTGRENVRMQGAILGVNEEEIVRRLPEIEAFADIGRFFDLPMKIYSSGMFSRLAFAAAIHVDPEILIIDEALSVGDVRFQEKCYRRFRDLQARGTTILLVTHDVGAVLNACDQGLVLDSGRMAFHGSARLAVDHYHSLIFGQGHIESEASRSGGEAPAIAAAKRRVEDFIAAQVDRDQCPANPFYNPDETRLGDRRAEIVDFMVVSNGLADPIQIPHGAEIDIYVKVRYLTDLRAPVIGMALVNAAGILVYGTNSQLAGVAIADAVTDSIRTYRISLVNRLVGGALLLNLGVSLSEIDGPVFVDVRRVLAKLDFAPRSEATGLADMSAESRVWELE